MPDSLVHFEKQGWQFAVLPEWKAALEAAVLDASPPLQPLPHAAGRGQVYCLESGGERGILRRYRRGGMMRFLFSHPFRWERRPARELALLRHLEENDFSSPAALGMATRPGILFAPSVLLTRALDARELPDALRSLGDGSGTLTLLEQCGALIARLHAMGIWHGDLNAHNILVADGRPVLIDFDKSRCRTPLPHWRAMQNLMRLRRSFEKEGLKQAQFDALCRGYGVVKFPAWLEMLYRLRRRGKGMARSNES